MPHLPRHKGQSYLGQNIKKERGQARLAHSPLCELEGRARLHLEELFPIYFFACICAHVHVCEFVYMFVFHVEAKCLHLHQLFFILSFETGLLNMKLRNL